MTSQNSTTQDHDDKSMSPISEVGPNQPEKLFPLSDAPPASDASINAAAVASAQRDLIEHLCRAIADAWIKKHSTKFG